MINCCRRLLINVFVCARLIVILCQTYAYTIYTCVSLRYSFFLFSCQLQIVKKIYPNMTDTPVAYTVIRYNAVGEPTFAALPSSSSTAPCPVFIDNQTTFRGSVIMQPQRQLNVQSPLLIPPFRLTEKNDPNFVPDDPTPPK